MTLLIQLRKKNWWNKRDTPNLACFCDPPLFEHDVDMTKRFRGSGRIASLAANENEQMSNYFCLDLDREYGFCNRAQTLALVMGMAASLKYGVYVLWTKRKACDAFFKDCIVFNHNSELFKELAFIQVFDRATDSKWKCARQNINQCRGLFDNQCQVDLGLQLFFDMVRGEALKTENKMVLDHWLPIWEKNSHQRKCGT